MPGYINTDLLTEGWYTITQIEAAKGYEMAKIVMKNVQVIAGKASVVEFTNAKRAAMILRNLNKADDSPLSGANISIWCRNDSNNVISGFNLRHGNHSALFGLTAERRKIQANFYQRDTDFRFHRNQP